MVSYFTVGFSAILRGNSTGHSIAKTIVFQMRNRYQPIMLHYFFITKDCLATSSHFLKRFNTILNTNTRIAATANGRLPGVHMISDAHASPLYKLSEGFYIHSLKYFMNTNNIICKEFSRLNNFHGYMKISTKKNNLNRCNLRKYVFLSSVT